MLILQKKSLRYISIFIFHFSVYPQFPSQTVIPSKPDLEITTGKFREIIESAAI